MVEDVFILRDRSTMQSRGNNGSVNSNESGVCLNDRDGLRTV